MSNIRFAHMGFNCLDPIRMEKFYVKYFGFRRARVIPLGEGQQIVFLRNDTVELELFAASAAAPGGPPEKDGPSTAGWRHIAFQVDDVDAKLAEMGDEAPITHGPFDFGAFIPGWRTVWIADPEGNIVEITQNYVDEENPPPLE